jgi:hypothetical protein
MVADTGEPCVYAGVDGGTGTRVVIDFTLKFTDDELDLGVLQEFVLIFV